MLKVCQTSLQTSCSGPAGVWFNCVPAGVATGVSKMSASVARGGTLSFLRKLARVSDSGKVPVLDENVVSIVEDHMIVTIAAFPHERMPPSRASSQPPPDGDAALFRAVEVEMNRFVD
jgi:hypothetical protein